MLTVADHQYINGVMEAHLLKLRVERRDAKEIEDHQVVDELDKEISYVKTLMSKVKYRTANT